jgi:hypothetical protein
MKNPQLQLKTPVQEVPLFNFVETLSGETTLRKTMSIGPLDLKIKLLETKNPKQETTAKEVSNNNRGPSSTGVFP